MYSRIARAIIGCSLLAISCSPQTAQNSQEPSLIAWENLQVTPKANDNLCTELTPEESEWERSKQDFTYGLLGDLRPEPTSNIHKLADRTAWVNSNEQQSLIWKLWYPEGNDRPANLRLFILLDEHQLNNALPQTGAFNDINLEKGDDISLKVMIPPLDIGVHDIIAIGIPYLEEYPNEYGIVTLVYWRITLISGPASSPFRQIDFVPLPAEGSMRKNDPAMALELTLKNNGIDVWNWPNPWLDINKNTPTTFFALAGHEDVTNLDAPPIDELETSFFSLLLFMDYEQINIAPNQIASYNSVDKDTAYTRIPIEIEPLPQGKHHILVLRIDSPGVPMCVLKGDPIGRILPNSVYGKLVGINVLPPK